MRGRGETRTHTHAEREPNQIRLAVATRDPVRGGIRQMIFQEEKSRSDLLELGIQVLLLESAGRFIDLQFGAGSNQGRQCEVHRFAQTVIEIMREPALRHLPVREQILQAAQKQEWLDPDKLRVWRVQLFQSRRSLFQSRPGDAVRRMHWRRSVTNGRANTKRKLRAERGAS